MFLLLVAALVLFVIRRARKERSRHEEVLNAFRTRNDFSSAEDLLWYTAREVVSRLGFSDCVIYRLDHTNKVCIQAAASGPKSPAGNSILNPIEIHFGRGIVGSVAESGKTERIGKATEDPRYIPDDDVRCSELTVPVIVKGKILAIIDSEEKPIDHFRQRDEELLVQVAKILGEKMAAL